MALVTPVHKHSPECDKRLRRRWKLCAGTHEGSRRFAYIPLASMGWSMGREDAR